MGHNKQNQNKKAIKIALGIFLCSFVIFLWKTNFFYINAQSNNAPINLSQEIQNRGITPIIENSNQEEAKKLESSNPIFDFFKNIQQRIEQQIQKPVDLEVKDNLPSTIDIQEIINKFKTNEDKEIEQNEPTDTQDDSEIPKIIDKIENNINQTETTTGSELQDKKTPSNIEDASSKLSNYISQKYFENELENSCGNQNNVIILEEGGHNLLPEYLSGDTFYILYGENYSFDYMLKITEDCTKILGKSGFTKLYTSNHEGATIKIISAKNTIIENIILEGEGDGFGGIHEKNNYGIYLASTGNFISNTQSYNQKRFAIYMEQPDNFTNLNSFFKHIIQKESDYNIEEITDGHVDDLSQTSDISTKTTNTIGEIKNLGKEANVVTTETIPKLKQIQEFSATNKPTKIKKDTKELESELIWNLFEKVEDKFVGKNPIDLSESDGKIPITLNLKSIDETIKVEIPKGTVFKTINNKNYTGVVISPQKAKNIGIGGSGSKIKSNSTFKVGSLEQKILLKDSKNDTDVYAKIEMELTGYKAGDMIPIYTSQDGEDWEYLGFFDVIEKDGKTIIDLETNHFSYISAGTHYGNYFKGSIQVTENFLSLNPLACHVSINGGAWQIAMMGMNGQCGWTRSNTYGFSIKFRLTENSGLDPDPREPIQLGDGDIGTLNTTTYQYGSNDTYYYDATAPSSSISPNGSTCSKGMSFSFRCSDGGVGCNSVHYKTIDGGMQCTDSGLSTISPGNAIGIAIPSGFEGTKKVCYKGVDRLGNSETIKTSNNFNIDNGQSTPSPTYPSAGGYVNTTRPTLTRNSHNLGCSNMSGYTVLFYYSTNCSTTPNVNWVTTESFTTSTLSNGSSYSWRVQGKDNLGNTSDLSTCRSFTVDTTLPTITINNPSTSPATSKTITASTNEGTLTMTAGSTSTTCNGTRTFVTYSSTTFSSEADNGKRICYRAVDAAGNIRYSLSNAIAGIDRTAPTGAPSCTANSYFSSSLAVTCTAGAGGTVVRYTTNGSNPTASSSIWSNQSFSSTTNLKAISCDALNNCNTSSITSRTYIKDTNAPSGGSFTINGGATHTKSTAVTLNVTCPTDAWTPIQVAYGNSASPTNRTSCTSSISHTLTSTNGSKTVYMRFRDGGNNTTSDTTKSIVLDTTAPTYVGYSNISGHSHVNGSDYWFKAGSELWIDITHSDNLGINQQYFGFNKSGCTPNNCGGAPDEIKSYNRSNIQTDWMTYDSHIDIYSSDCVDSDGSCTDNDLTRKRKSSIKSTIPDYDYRLNVYSYDFAANGVGYTNLGIWIKIDGTNPATSITSPSAGSRQNGSFNVSISDTDARSGIGTCRYRILDNGTQSLGWTSRTCNSTITINQSSYCSTQGTNKCTIESYSIDNVGNTSSTVSRSFSIDTISPSPPTCTTSRHFSSTSLSVSCSTSEGTIKFTTNGTNPTCSSSTWSNRSFSATTDLKVAVCDAAGNLSIINAYKYIKDTTNPSGTYTLDPNTITNTNVNITVNPTDNFGVKSIQLPNNNIITGGVLPTLINPNTRVIGTNGSQPGFGLNGSTTENKIILKENPRNIVDKVWASEQNDSTSDADGGWNSDTFSIDKTKKYRSVVWIRRENTGNGRTYFGTLGSHVNNLNGTVNTNPYFRSFLVSDVPQIKDNRLLLVGHIHPYTYSSTSSDPESGIYNIYGDKVANMTDFKRTSTATASRHRTFLYYSTSTTERQYRYRPRFEVVDGNEPSIQDLLQGKETANSIDYEVTGNGTYNFTIKDRADNSFAIAASVTNIDKTAPTLSANNSSTSWKTSNISITLSVSDTNLNISKYRWNNSDCRNGTNFTNGNIITQSTDGSHTLYLCANDSAGNTKTWNGTYKLDKTNPTVSASPAGGSFSSNITITLYGADNLSLAYSKYSWISAADCLSNGTSYSNGSTITKTSEGTQTLYLCVGDSAGRTNTASYSFTRDTTAPTGAPSCTANAYFSSSISVTCTAGAGGTVVRYTTNGSNPTASSSIWSNQSFSSTTNLKAISCDALNNCNTSSITSRTYTKDTTAPSGGSFTINGGATHTNSTSVTLNITCPTDVWTPIQVAYGNSAAPTNRTSCTSSISHTLTSTNGSKTVYMRFRDGGNNTTSDTTKSIVLDTISPSLIFTGSTPANGALVNGTDKTLQMQITDVGGLGNFAYTRNGVQNSLYDSSLVLMMNFDNISALGESASVVKDLSIYGNNSTINGNTTWTSNGKYNGAYQFSGSNISLGNSFGNFGTNDFTISFWGYSNGYYSHGSVYNFFLSKGQLANNNNMGFYYTSSNNIGFMFSGSTTITSSISALNTRRHISATRSGNLFSLYIDGNLIGTNTSNFSLSNSDNFYLGREGNSARHFSGSLDELRVYNRALSAGEINLLYRSNLNKYSTTQWLLSVDQTLPSANGTTYGYSGYTLDIAGNTATTISRTMNVDNISPITTDNGNNTRRSNDFSVTLTPNETSTTRYCIGTSSCTPTTIGTTANITCAAGTTCASQYVRYYSTDTAGNIEATKTSAQIRIDKQVPTFTFSNNSGPECTAGTLSITSASDAGAGLHSSPYSFNGSTWNTTTSTSITAQQPGTQVRTGRVRDSLGNSSSKTATYTFTNVAPTASNFIGHSSVGNTARTVNRKTLSNAQEGSCGNSSITYNSIITQGTKGTCSVVGDNITYTPNTNQIGTDSCVIQIKDNENSTVNFTASWEGIDTQAPTAAPNCTPSTYFSGTIAVTCTVGAGGTQIRYTTGGVDPSPSSPIWSNQSFSSTTTLKAISCDALNNCNVVDVETEIYTKDTLAPISTISDTNSNRRNTNISTTLNGTDAGVGGVTTFYKTIAGYDQTCTAGGYSKYSSAISITANIGEVNQQTLCYYSTDNLGNTETTKKQNYRIDKSDPAVSAPAIYGGTSFGNYFKGTISLRSSISDIGAGILASSCMRSVNSATWTGIGVTQDASYCMYNTYTPNTNFNIKFLVKDQATNTGISNQSDFIYDNTAPTIGTPAIYAGTTYNNTYFKGTISIQATATDAGSNINTSTCEYSLNNGTSRSAASFAGGFCQITNISPTNNLQILVRAKDNLGTTGTSLSKTYTYDNTPPTTTDNATSARTKTDQIISLSANDAGAGVANTYYCITNSGGACTPNILGTSILVTGNINEVTNKQIKYYSTDNLNTDEITKTSVVIRIDKQAPNIELIRPENNFAFDEKEQIILTWSGNDGIGIGVSGYHYEIYNSNDQKVLSGTTANTGIMVSGLTEDTYTRRIIAYDILYNESVSSTGNFIVQSSAFVVIPNTSNSGTIQTAFTNKDYIQTIDGLVGYKPLNLRNNNTVCPQIPIFFQSTGDIEGNNINIEFPGCFSVKTIEGSFTGVIETPKIETEITAFSLINNTKDNIVSIGASGEQIFFVDNIENPLNVKVLIPTPSKEIGTTIEVYSSQDGKQREYFGTGLVSLRSGEKYTTFETNHFTYFTIGTTTGNFVINNDDEETTSKNVTLNMNVDGATQMKFGHSTGDVESASWITYSGTHQRELTEGLGTKTVYAMFTDGIDTGYVSDDILLTQETEPPTVSTGYITVGTTGENGSNLYYKGTISIKADVSDNVAIDSGSCEYNLTGTRYPASGTDNYCQVQNISTNEDINIQFRVEDTSGNLGTGPTQTYLYDNTAPSGGSFNINNGDDYTSGTNLQLQITCPTDGGIGGIQMAYGTEINPENRQSCTSTKTQSMSSINETKIVYLRFKDDFDNITSNIVENIILDTIGPSAPNLIIPDEGYLFDTGNIQLIWNTGIDTGIGTDKYNYTISTNSDFSTIYTSGFTQNTGTTVNLQPGAYYWKVRSIDLLGNIGDWSNTRTFEYSEDIHDPIIIFTGETLEDNSTTTGNTIIIDTEITEENLSSLTQNRNGQQTSLYDSGLVLMMNFDNNLTLGETTGEIIKDFSLHGNHGTGFGGLTWTGNGRYGGAYTFDGIDSYIELNNISGTSNNLTISTRIKPTYHDGISRGFLVKGNDGTRQNNEYGLRGGSSNNVYSFFIANEYSRGETGAVLDNLTFTIPSEKINERVHIVATTSKEENTLSIYLDGKIIAEKERTVINIGGNKNRQLYIGQGYGGTSSFSGSFWSGLIDEVRIYNRALSSGEIKSLYETNLAKIDENKRQLETQQQCLPDGNYFYELIAKDKYYNTTKSRNFTVNLPAPTIGTPSQGLNISGISASILEQTKEFDFTGVDNTFRVYDTKGYTGWYTTISLSGDLTNQDSTQSIDKENVFFKAQNKILTLEGVESDSILISEGISTYKAMTGVITYMFKELNDECNSCIVGKYANNPSIKLNIPAFQKADTYHGTMIFTLYD